MLASRSTRRLWFFVSFVVVGMMLLLLVKESAEAATASSIELHDNDDDHDEVSMQQRFGLSINKEEDLLQRISTTTAAVAPDEDVDDVLILADGRLAPDGSISRTISTSSFDLDAILDREPRRRRPSAARRSSVERHNYNDENNDVADTAFHQRFVLAGGGEDNDNEKSEPSKNEDSAQFKTPTAGVLTAAEEYVETLLNGSLSSTSTPTTFDFDPILDRRPIADDDNDDESIDFDPVLDHDPWRRRLSSSMSSRPLLQRELLGYLKRGRVGKRFGHKTTYRDGEEGKGGKGKSGSGMSGSSNDDADDDDDDDDDGSSEARKRMKKSGRGKSGKGKSLKCDGKQGKGGTSSSSKSSSGKGRGNRKSRFRGKGKGNSKSSGSSSKSGKECDDDEESPTVSLSPTIAISMSPTGSPTECPINEVVRWVLVDADSQLPGAEIRDLSTPADTLVLDDVMAQNLGLIVEVADPGDCTESILFVADFLPVDQDRLESRPPYSLGSDNAAAMMVFPVPELSQPGTYTIGATPFTQDRGRGDVGPTATLTLTVVVSASLQSG